MLTLGTHSKYGVPVSYQFTYDNGTVDWGSALATRVSDVSNSSDPINGRRKVSNLSVSLYDPAGAVWTALGGGTTAFGKQFGMDITIGGTLGLDGSEIGERMVFKGTQGGNTFGVHQGNITTVGKADKVVTLESQNILNLLDKVKWQPPIQDSDTCTFGSVFDKFAFLTTPAGPVEVGSVYWDTFFVKVCGYRFNNDNTGCDFYAVTNAQADLWVDYQGTGIYDTTDGTGIVAFLNNSFSFYDTTFHYNHPLQKFKGTFIDNFIGTITSNDSAKAFGYDSADDAETKKVPAAGGTYYPINKIRVEFPNDVANNTGNLQLAQPINLTGDPTGVLRHMLYGKMVTDYFEEDNHKDDSSWDESRRISAFKTYSQYVDPDDEKVYEYISDLLKTEMALFYVTNSNKFAFRSYGPKDLYSSITEFGSAQILNSSYSNDVNEYYNRVVIKYNYNISSKEYTNTWIGTLSDWEPLNDRPYEIESGWIDNGNLARITGKRILKRFDKTNPKIDMEITLEESGMDLGSLYKITDTNSGLSEKIIQAVEYNKGFSSSKTIKVTGLDGDALYFQRGYAIWEGDNDLEAPVSSTSQSGWGINGTVHNINTTLHGTQFVWF